MKKRIIGIVIIICVTLGGIFYINTSQDRMKVEFDNPNQVKSTDIVKQENGASTEIKDINNLEIDIENDYNEPLSKAFFKSNREKVINDLEENSVLILYSGKSPRKNFDVDYKHTVDRNFYYLTGLTEENLILLITKKENEVKEYLFLDPMHIGADNEWVTVYNGIFDINQFEDKLSNLLSSDAYKTLYIDLLFNDSLEDKGIIDSLSNTHFGTAVAQLITKEYPNIRIENVYQTIGKYRVLKTDEELEKIKKAIHITHEGIKSIMKNTQPGMTEYQIEAYFDFVIQSLGARDHSFPTIAASGKNAMILHYSENDDVVQENDLILFDLGAEYDYYASDISRTIPANGTFSDRQKEIYNIVLKANQEAIKAVKPGISIVELNQIAKDILIEECKKIGLIKEASEIRKYYYHFVGHFVGLYTHDVGNYREGLQPGMVITIEPGLYIKEESIGVRIEDMLLITEDGYINLSEDIIKTVEEIEAFMN